MRAMPFLQIVNGKYRVRIVVPPHLRPYLLPPHTGKANLTRALGTGNKREANRLAVPWIADSNTARKAGLTDYRVVVNVGPTAGQTVFHLHWHILGGRTMGENL